LNPHVLADTRPSTSACLFYLLFCRSTRALDLDKCRLGATRCNVQRTSRRTISIRFWIKIQRFTTNYLMLCRVHPRLFPLPTNLSAHPAQVRQQGSGVL
jgi:hypothetical protein